MGGMAGVGGPSGDGRRLDRRRSCQAPGPRPERRSRPRLPAAAVVARRARRPAAAGHRGRRRRLPGPRPADPRRRRGRPPSSSSPSSSASRRPGRAASRSTAAASAAAGYDPDAASKYPWEIARDVALLAASVFVAWLPSTRLSLDSLLFRRYLRVRRSPDMSKKNRRDRPYGARRGGDGRSSDARRPAVAT